MPQERADAVALTLPDIEGAAERIHSALLETSDGSNEELRERLWEIREEFRHIGYHMRDGELTGL